MLISVANSKHYKTFVFPVFSPTEKIPTEFGDGRLFSGRDPLGGGEQEVFFISKQILKSKATGHFPHLKLK